MIKVSVMYPNKPGARFDQAYLAPVVEISEVLVERG
jgi:hypothetical protein